MKNFNAYFSITNGIVHVTWLILMAYTDAHPVTRLIAVNVVIHIIMASGVVIIAIISGKGKTSAVLIQPASREVALSVWWMGNQ